VAGSKTAAAGRNTAAAESNTVTHATRRVAPLLRPGRSERDNPVFHQLHGKNGESLRERLP